VLSREAANTNFTVFGFDPNALDASTLTITLITDVVYISIYERTEREFKNF
jgi:hypothetical protein